MAFGAGLTMYMALMIQKCSYCDFTTFGLHQVVSTEAYVELLVKEINLRQNVIPHRKLDSIYFG